MSIVFSQFVIAFSWPFLVFLGFLGNNSGAILGGIRIRNLAKNARGSLS